MPHKHGFQSKAERLRRKHFLPLPFSKERSLASYSSPEAEQGQPCALESNSHSEISFLLLEWPRASGRAAPEQLWNPAGDIWGILQMYLLQHTHHRGPCVSPCYLHLETETGTEIAHQAKSCGPVHSTAELLNDWYWHHSTHADKAQCTNTDFRFVSRDIYFDCEMQGACSACRKLPKKYAQDLYQFTSPSHQLKDAQRPALRTKN